MTISLLLALMAAAPEKPNILWLSCEDMGPHTGFCGMPGVRTPHLDALARRSTWFRKVWSHAPVCAPSRTGIILGRHATSVGAEPMRSMVSLPGGITMFPQELMKAGYYCTNNSKEDYSVEKPGKVWHESSARAHYRNRASGQPFFAVFNDTITHESQIRNKHALARDPASVTIPPYWPDTPEVRRDWSQYLDRIEEMDAGIGKRIGELEKAGVADSTVVVFFSDHGSGMPRHKRWAGNSGLRVPLLVHVPKMWASKAAPYLKPGTSTDRLAGLVDLGPSMLALAGIEPPAGLDGRDFLSARAGDPPPALWGHRSRMDERLDLVRSVFDGRFVLIRNFHLQRPHGQHVAYQFETPTTRIWKDLFDRAKLNAVQSRFWMPREAEELYDLDADPHETVNLADSPASQADADRLRRLLRERILKTRDLGFVPEGMLETMRGANAPLEWGARDSNYPLEKLLEAALLAARKDGEAGRILALSRESHPGLRYWAAMGAACRPGESATLRPMLLGLLADASPSVRVAAADALARTSRTDAPKAREILLAAASIRENGLPATLEALNALDAMGPASPEELKRLEKGLAGADKVNQRLRSYTERLMDSLRGAR